MSHRPDHVSLGSALARLGKGERYATVFERGTVEVGVYRLADHDPQSPHDRDEFYFVAQGRGTFLNGERRCAFGPGDMLFVPAGQAHRFEDFSPDLAVWVVFYGPEDE